MKLKIKRATFNSEASPDPNDVAAAAMGPAYQNRLWRGKGTGTRTDGSAASSNLNDPTWTRRAKSAEPI